MPKFTGQAREILKIIKPYGFHLEQNKKHTWVMKGEARIVSMATTPGDRNSYKVVIKSLIRLGHLPPSCRR